MEKNVPEEALLISPPQLLSLGARRLLPLHASGSSSTLFCFGKTLTRSVPSHTLESEFLITFSKDLNAFL